MDASYIDYESFLDPSFRSASFANTLVLATNNPNDVPLDLSTPLSRVLFDVQEIDSHIDALTTRSAEPLLAHTQAQTAASKRIVSELDAQVTALNDSYAQLEKDVIRKHAEADEVRAVAVRLWETLRLARDVNRCLQLGRQLEAQHAEPDAHGALVRCATTVVTLRDLLAAPNLDRVAAARSLGAHVVEPIERSTRERAERAVREFSVGTAAGPATFAQSEDARERTASALTALYLLDPALMLAALDAYLRSAIQSSTAGLSRALAALPSLDRALAEVAARCHNVVALEAVLEGTRAPDKEKDKENLLQPLLAHLETASLASYFWRSVAGGLAARVQDMAARGGPPVRALRTQRTAVADAIRECVVKGSQLPSAVAAGARGKNKGSEKPGGWEREAAVMVGAVVGNLGR